MPDEDIRVRVRCFKFQTFDPKDERWQYYIERFEVALKLQDLVGGCEAEEAIKNLLLKWIGAEQYRKVRDNFQPTPVHEKGYEDIKKFFNQYFKPTTSYLVERIKFGKLSRKSDQTITEYVNESRSVAVE